MEFALFLIQTQMCMHLYKYTLRENYLHIIANAYCRALDLITFQKSPNSIFFSICFLLYFCFVIMYWRTDFIKLHLTQCKQMHIQKQCNVKQSAALYAH